MINYIIIILKNISNLLKRENKYKNSNFIIFFVFFE